MRNLVVLACLMFASVAHASPLTLTPLTDATALQQVTNNPCVLGNNDCSSHTTAVIPSWTDTPTGGNSGWDLTSPNYNVALVRNIFGNNLRMGADFSQNSNDQVLNSFHMLIDGVIVDSFTGPVAVPPTEGGNAGNGFADYILTGFNLAPYAATSSVSFRGVMGTANDGPDQFFLIAGLGTTPCPTGHTRDGEGNCVPNPTGIPEPTSLAMLGIGLVGVGWLKRRRR